jgi:hypothetical protein
MDPDVKNELQALGGRVTALEHQLAHMLELQPALRDKLAAQQRRDDAETTGRDIATDADV